MNKPCRNGQMLGYNNNQNHKYVDAEHNNIKIKIKKKILCELSTDFYLFIFNSSFVTIEEETKKKRENKTDYKDLKWTLKFRNS